MIINVLAKPNSKIDKAELMNNVLYVKIKARPVDGEANNYLVKYLAEILSVSKSSIVIVRGHSSKYKVVEIPISIEELEDALLK